MLRRLFFLATAFGALAWTGAFTRGPRTRQSYQQVRLAATSTEPVLPIDDVAARWQCIKYGQDGFNAIEVADRDYCFTTHQFTVKRTGGLGLDLLEYNAAEKGNMGLVLVGGVVPGSNAAACGGFVVGDALVEVSAAGGGGGSGGEATATRLEGLNFDSTVNELSRYSECSEVVLTVKRMARRGEVTVVMVGPGGEDAGSFKVLWVNAISRQNRRSHLTSSFLAHPRCGRVTEATCGSHCSHRT